MAASPRVHARSGTVLHLLVLGQQGDRHLLNGNSQPRRCPVARRRAFTTAITARDGRRRGRQAAARRERHRVAWTRKMKKKHGSQEAFDRYVIKRLKRVGGWP
jgi:hypothetical protein